MTERQVTYRLRSVGGNAVKAEFKGIGEAGREGMERVARGTKSAEASAKTFTRTLEREERSFRALKASIDPVYAAQQRLERVQAQLNRQQRLGIITTEEAATVMRQYEQRTLSMARTSQIAGREARVMTGHVRMAGLQVSQIVSQGSMLGGVEGYFRAASIQAADLGLAFGTIGIAVGAALTALGPFVADVIFGGEAAETASERVNKLEQAMSALRAANERSTLSLSDAVKTYGSLAQGAQELFAIQRQLASMAADSAVAGVFQGAARGLGLEDLAVTAAQIRGGQSEIDMLTNAIQKMRKEFDAATGPATELEIAIEDLGAQVVQLEQVRDRASDVADAFGLTEAGAQKVVQAFAAINEADNAQERAQAHLDLANSVFEASNGLRDASEDGRDLYDQLIAAAEAMLDIAAIDLSNVAAGADEAARLAQNLAIAAGQRSDAAVGGNVDFFDPRNEAGLSGVIPQDRPVPAQNRPGYTPRRPARRAGGGGGGARLGAAEREAAQIYNRTRTALESYNAEVARANELRTAGLLSAETHNRYLDQLAENLRDAQTENRALNSLMRSSKDAVLDFAMGSRNAFQQLAQSIKRAALELLLFGEGPLARRGGGGVLGGGLFGGGGLLGGLFGRVFNFDGGGETPDGPRTGGLDGKGGMRAIVHPNERWIDKTKSQNAARDGDPVVPVFMIDTGVKVEWLRQSQAASAQMLGAYDLSARRGMPGQLSDARARGLS